MKQNATAILVLGMHRSGTSALAGALQHLGVPLGGALVPAAEDNPGGYFENAGAVTLNDTLLLDIGRGWDDIRPLPPGWRDTRAASEARLAIEQVLDDDFEGLALWALKDPRLCRVLPLWRDVLEERGNGVVYLLMVRHPDEVAASLAARDQMPAQHANLLWLQHVLGAERESRGATRAWLHYQALLDDPVNAMAKVSRDLGLEWPQEDALGTLSGVIEKSQRHHQHHPDDPQARGPRRWALEAFRRLTDCTFDVGYADALQEQVAKRVARLQPWIAGPADSLARARRAHAATHGLVQRTEEALAATTRLAATRLEALHSMDGRLQETDRALQQAESQSVSRLQDLEAREARLAMTQAALHNATALCDARLVELHDADTRMKTITLALHDAEALSIERLEALSAAEARVNATATALSHAEDLCGERLSAVGTLETALGEMQALAIQRLRAVEAVTSRLAKTDEGLARSAELVARLQEELRSQAKRIEKTDEALATSELRAKQRTDDVSELGRRLHATEKGLAHAELLAVDRLQAMTDLSRRIERAEQGLAQASSLATERLAQLEDLQHRLDRTEAGLVEASALAMTHRETAGRASARAELAEQQLQAILGSAFWKRSRWLRKLAGDGRGEPAA